MIIAIFCLTENITYNNIFNFKLDAVLAKNSISVNIIDMLYDLLRLCFYQIKIFVEMVKKLFLYHHVNIAKMDNFLRIP